MPATLMAAGNTPVADPRRHGYSRNLLAGEDDEHDDEQESYGVEPVIDGIHGGIATLKREKGASIILLTCFPAVSGRRCAVTPATSAVVCEYAVVGELVAAAAARAQVGEHGVALAVVAGYVDRPLNSEAQRVNQESEGG